MGEEYAFFDFAFFDFRMETLRLLSTEKQQFSFLKMVYVFQKFV